MMSQRQRRQYYQNLDVRARVREFIGEDNLKSSTGGYLAAGDESERNLTKQHPYSTLDSLFDQGLEIYRSLHDDASLIADFDVEYVNFDRPEMAFVDPEGIFALQQPVAEVIENVLAEYGIKPLHFLSGRGHHFTWRMQRDSGAFRRLVGVGEGMKGTWTNADDDLSRAFGGLGLVMEFLAYHIKERAAPLTKIPVELTAIEVGPSPNGREMISLDISEYGDPLLTRMLRVPFTVYLKPWQHWWEVGSGPLQNVPSLVAVPVPENQSWANALKTMRDPVAMEGLARISCTKIPDATEAIKRLIDDYETSDVGRFHNWFYSEEQHGPDRWSETYDRLSMEILPACVRMVLEQPNDLLLKPSRIRQLVRVMLALGWHPRHIAGLIFSKYARPFGWTQFAGYNRAMRADFYTRIFAGLFTTGRDDLIDFNCVSAQEQQICPFANCGFNLLEFKTSALQRRTHEKLAHRPFNRLLS